MTTSGPGWKQCVGCDKVKALNSYKEDATGEQGRRDKCHQCERIDRGMKRCTKCGHSKPLSAYAGDPRNKDGKHSQCQECSNRERNEWRRRKKVEAVEGQMILPKSTDYQRRGHDTLRGTIRSEAVFAQADITTQLARDIERWREVGL